MEYLFIYLLQVAHMREGFLFILTTIALISTFVTLATMTFGTDKGEEAIHKLCKKTLITSIILWLLVAFFPSERTLIMSGGVFLGKTVYSKVTTSDKIQKVSTLIDLQLDKLIKEYREAGK